MTVFLAFLARTQPTSTWEEEKDTNKEQGRGGLSSMKREARKEETREIGSIMGKTSYHAKSGVHEENQVGRDENEASVDLRLEVVHDVHKRLFSQCRGIGDVGQRLGGVQ